MWQEGQLRTKEMGHRLGFIAFTANLMDSHVCIRQMPFSYSAVICRSNYVKVFRMGFISSKKLS